MTRLIVTDIDGTLVGDGQGAESMNPEYYDAILRLTEKGIKFMACSGRQRVSIAKLFRPVRDKIFYACDGGSMVFDKENLLFAKVLKRETAMEIIRDAQKILPCDIMVCGTKRAYCRSKDSELYRWMVNGYGYDIEAVGDLTKNIPDDIVKVSVYHQSMAEELTNPWFRPKWENKVKLSLAGIQWLDCVPADAGKKSAVQFMQQHFGITKEETIVFGDNQNDMEMFSLAGRSYAVDNAREEVKQAASHRCGGYQKNGVLEVLKKLIICDNMTK
ncbi:MAG: HAD family hydrolase [Lachnospiraceae bacterium]|nr:HAD family hydrolase [Lachnospiraceae bacterium]